MQKNRSRTLVLTLILAATIASGCTNTLPAQQTTVNIETRRPADANEYLNDLQNTFHDFANSSFSLTDELTARNFEGARKSLDNMETALKSLGSIEAPEKYADLQAKLNDSLSGQLEYIDNCRKFVGYGEKGNENLTAEDIEEVQKLNEKLDAVPDEFTKAYTELIKAIAADLKAE